eukprot:CAMPEP_0194209660 /NCGR_PEP_ID=MMETSP0156-20130528/7701_1 /TAXON_ID=33649 /ORGANISM="Thalassionema nitzschioides, Strain L26-B" /LENGTH=222 /DNA_ID=CAMNT_0038936861 /DNA_START=172 /DNA_END=840 /DNA_ORIENTATION=+
MTPKLAEPQKVKSEHSIIASGENARFEEAEEPLSRIEIGKPKNGPVAELEVAKLLCTMNYRIPCYIPSGPESLRANSQALGDLDKPAPGWNPADGAFLRIRVDSIADVAIADTHGTQGTKIWREMVREQPGSRYFTADQAKAKFIAIIRQRYPGLSVRFWCKIRTKHGSLPEVWNTLPKDKRARIVNRRKRPPYLGYYKEADEKEIVTNLVTRRERKSRAQT